MTNPAERWRVLARSTDRVKRAPVRNEVEGQSTAKVYLYDVIDSWGGPFGLSAREFLDSLNELGDVDRIELHINSPGGDVYEGIAIRNALRQHDAKVTTVIDGIAASAASFIAVAADEVVMSANSELMIHNAWGVAIGNAGDLRELADRLDHHDLNIAAMYQAKAGGEVADWQGAMTDETWYSADEAVDAGLADRTDAVQSTDGDSAAAKDRYDLSIFNHAGREKAPAPTFARNESPQSTPAAAPADGTKETPTKEGSTIVAFSDESTATLRQKLGVADDADEATILDALDETLNERAEPQNTATELPEGVTTIEQSVLDELRANAEAGRQARTQQEREGREQVVNAAIADGRIAPARREAWLNRIEADPAEAETLKALEKGLVPLAEAGHADEDAASDTTKNTAYQGWSF